MWTPLVPKLTRVLFLVCKNRFKYFVVLKEHFL